MLKHVFIACCLFLCTQVYAQEKFSYSSLDESQPIFFTGSHVTFNGTTITLGRHAFFIDGRLTDAEASRFPFVFNSIAAAARQLTNGTETEPMTLYIAPWVYWIDDPDDATIRVPAPGTNTPYGMEITCEWLKFQGLNAHPENVVLASNRGQTIGARGNFTMFKFTGQGTASENISFGNYCNVDLVYPLKPALNRAKRAAAIVQAQLIHCNGDKIVARNTRFISRLNLCPFAGGKRVLFDQCHFESTDDALCATGVYLNSSFDFYSSKPFYNTRGTGAVLLNCSVQSFSGSNQYFTKAGGQVAVIDCKFTGNENTYWGWQEVVPQEARNYQANITRNGKMVFIGRKDKPATVDISAKPLLSAYRFVHADSIVYNTYNLLQGDDDWDPMQIKNLVLQHENNSSLSKIPVQLIVSPTGKTIETGRDELVLTATQFRFGNYLATGQKVHWRVEAKDSMLVRLKESMDGNTCTIIPANALNDEHKVVVTAYTAAGLEGAAVVVVQPKILPAPRVISKPVIMPAKNGTVTMHYQLEGNFKDESDVRWYRCTDATGSGAIEVAVSRNDKPLREYRLTAGDVGYWIGANMSPKHIRSLPGELNRVVMRKPIGLADVKADSNVLETDFANQSVATQEKIIPGFFTWRHSQPGVPDPGHNIDQTRDAWFYGEGQEGAAGVQGLLQARHAEMSFTPVGHSFGDMKLTLTVSPFKTAGQGFSVAHLYMDVMIKYDAATRSGYALRLIRTTKYGDAVDCILVKYNNGDAQPISDPVSTSAFRTPCTIVVLVDGHQLSASVSTTAPPQKRKDEGVSGQAELTTTIEASHAGGFGINYHGGSPTMINNIRVEWTP